jgi:hypothetical protein
MHPYTAGRPAATPIPQMYVLPASGFRAHVFHSSRLGTTLATRKADHFQQIKWSSQDTSVLQGYRRAYRLDTPSTFKNPLSHVVLGQGIGKFSPTMTRDKSKRRVHKDQLALAVRKNFNALGVTESDVIVDWLYKSKHQGTPLRIFLTRIPLLTSIQIKSFESGSHRNGNDIALHHVTHTYTSLHFRRFFTIPHFWLRANLHYTLSA